MFKASSFYLGDVMKKRTTITDIANACGISKSSVSRVLTKKGYVSSEIANEVLKCAKEMNYIPQKSHNKNIKDMVMIISCQLSSDAQVKLSNAITNTLANKQIKAVIASCKFGDHIVYEYLEYAREKNFGGVILLGALETEELKRSLASLSCPIVLLNQTMDFIETSSVILDEYECTYQAIQYLIDCHHQHIAFISGEKNASAIKDREKGYYDCLKKNHLEKNSCIIHKSFEQKSGVEFAHELVNQHFPYSAIMFAADEICNGFLLESKKLNIQIPEDISVITFGDTLQSKTFDPSLTVIDYDFEEIGHQLASLLIYKMEKPYSKCKKIIEKPKFIIRKSVTIV